MKKNFIVSLFIFTVFLLMTDDVRSAERDTYAVLGEEYLIVAQLEAAGYECFISGSIPVCSKQLSLISYGAYQNDYRTLTGYANYDFDIVNILSYSPFLYLQNPPEGMISVNLDSKLNKYYPTPSFNQENGWLIESKDTTLSVNGKKQEHLFYELELKKLTINRNGENFSSKEELIEYLNNSDFLTKLGFSETEKKNSLEYFIPKLQESKEQNYYYLTILSDTSISEIAKLKINPEPKNIIRQYFAVYPTPVPVKTVGGFIFPEYIVTSNEYTAKETGEFLIHDSMQMFFE